MRPICKALIVAALTAPGCAHAVELCAWMTETVEEEQMRRVQLHLQADADLSFYYSMAGNGFSEEDGGRSHSPGSGTFVLHRGEPGEPWGFGATLYPPGDIDIVAEIHEVPKDIFSDEPTPLLAAFAFRRHIPQDEVEVPPTLAQKQCVAVTAPK